MKSRLPYILIVIGVICMIFQSVYQVRKDKATLQEQILFQEKATIEGLKIKWRKILLKKAQLGEFKNIYSLEWSRTGKELREPFFPLKQSSVDWLSYRKFKKNNQKEKMKNFLQEVFKKENSWSRILAIKEWHKQGFGNSEKVESQTKYESTLFNPEAREAYKLIFNQFNQEKDFTFVSKEVLFDKVFIHTTESGSIKVFVPSIKEIRNSIINKFAKNEKIPKPILSKTPWDIEIRLNSLSSKNRSFAEVWILIIGMLFLFSGILFYLQDLRNKNKLVIKKVSFLNQVVHELKTPLTGLKLHLQLVQKGIGGKDSIKTLLFSLEKINNLFDDVVLMNKPSEKVVGETILAETLNGMLNEFSEEFHNLNIKSYFNQNIKGEIKRLRVILRNLIKNGIKYGGSVEVEIVSLQKRNIIITVKDSGPGVNKDESDKIFTEFYRSEKAVNINPDGLGMGLFLVKRMALEINADVTLENPGEEGAVFKISLPKSDKNEVN